MKTEEQLLIKKCRENEPDAQFEIYRRYYKTMYNTCYRLVNQKEEAEDIVQESFLSAFRNIGSFHNVNSFGAWLRKIVVNRTMDYLRKNRPITVSLEKVELVEDMDPEIEYRHGFTVEKVQKGIHLLPEGYRIVLNLYLLEGYDYEEVGQILGIQPSTARSQFSRAKTKLIEILKNMQI